MNKYGQAAFDSVKLLEEKQALTPMDAWNVATIAIFGKGTHSQKKGCPRNAFIGLCEEGLVRGITGGNHSERKSQKIKDYAIRAIELLKENPTLVGDKMGLWDAVMDGEVKKHNSQMDVVLFLWKNGQIRS